MSTLFSGVEQLMDLSVLTSGKNTIEISLPNFIYLLIFEFSDCLDNIMKVMFVNMVDESALNM